MYRKNEFGEAAAERLTLLDQERSVWRQRVEVYTAAKQQISANGETSESEIAELLDNSFTKLEQLRVMAQDGSFIR